MCPSTSPIIHVIIKMNKSCVVKCLHNIVNKHKQKMHGITHHQTTNFLHRRKNTEFPKTYMPINVQQDATMYSLFISVNRSTFFGWYLHPSSGAHVTANDENSGQQHLRQESEYHPKIRPERHIAEPASYVRSSHRNSKENHIWKNFTWILPSTSNTLSLSLKLCSVIQRPNFRISLWTDTLSYEPRHSSESSTKLSESFLRSSLLLRNNRSWRKKHE